MSVSEALRKWDKLAPSVLDIYYVFNLCNNIDWCMNVRNWNKLRQNKIKKTYPIWLGTRYPCPKQLGEYTRVVLQKDVQNLLTNYSSDNFTNLFHEFFSVWAVEKENKLLIGSKQVFFLSLLVEKEIIINIC